MAIHTVLFRNAAQAASANLVALALQNFTNDNVAPGPSWLPHFPAKLVAASGFGATMSDLRVSTPLILQTNQMILRPWNIGIVPVTDYNLCNLKDFGITFNTFENVQPVSSNSNAGATDDQWCVMWFSDGRFEKPSGVDMIIELTSATTVTANAWTRCALTPVQTLPNARFSVLGMDVVSATGICARLNIPGWASGGNPMSPGCIPLPTIGLRQAYPLYDQPFGQIGQFTNQTLPALEIFCKAADTSARVFLWVRKM